MKEKTIQITTRVIPNVYEALTTLSSKTGKSIAEITRQYIDKGLTVESYKDDMDFIRKQIREELKSQLYPATERIVKLIVKSGIMSAGAYYLNAETISGLLPEFKQQEYKEVLEKSKKYGVAHFGLNDVAVEHLIRDLKQI